MDCRASSGKLAFGIVFTWKSKTTFMLFINWASVRPDLFFLHEEKFDFDVSLSPAR